MKISIAIMFLVSVILCSALLDITNAQSFTTSQPPASPQSTTGVCTNKCDVRCALKGRNSRCMKYCMMCCGKCSCVPSGTSGNLNECPCYRDWKAPNGRPKCP